MRLAFPYLAAAILAGASPAIASNLKDSRPAATSASSQSNSSASTQAVSVDEIEQHLAADGFRILEIERYARSVEVKGLDRNGRCTEMHLDASTGAVLRQERDDDCGGDVDDRRHGGRR